MYEIHKLTKKRFFQKNRTVIENLLSEINGGFGSLFGADYLDVTELDFAVVLNAEGGLQSRTGYVDPEFEHSLNERGLFPLPSNITYWIGGNAPDWDKPMPIAENIESYVRYMSALKNKLVRTSDGYDLYRGFFRQDGIKDDAIIQARVLAGIIHGYFQSGKLYRGQKAPYTYLVDGYTNGRDLSDMMAQTSYVFSGSDIISNRERNIEDALTWL